MEKATNIIRRSGIRLRGASSGHTELQLVISELKTLKAVIKQLGSSQLSTSQDMLQWATVENNRALQDMAAFTAELNAIYNDLLMNFSDVVKDFRQHFEQILAAETHIEDLRTQSSASEAKATKMRKDLKKTMKKGNEEETKAVENRVKEAEKAADLVQIELRDRVKESEIEKFIRLKKGFIELGQAQLTLSKQTQILAEAQIEIAKTLPEVEDMELQDITYLGSALAREAIEEAKAQISALKRQTARDEDVLPAPPAENPDLPPPYEGLNLDSKYPPSRSPYPEIPPSSSGSPTSFTPSAPPSSTHNGTLDATPPPAAGWKPSPV